MAPARPSRMPVARAARLIPALGVAACVLAAAGAPAPARAQTEAALPMFAAPLFRVAGWVERVEDTHVTLRAPDGRPLEIDMSELGIFATALTPGRLVGVTVLALPDGSLTARSVSLDYEGPHPTGAAIE